MNSILQNWKLHTILCLFCIVIIYYVLPTLIYILFLVGAALGGVAIAVVYHPGPYQRRDHDTYPSPPTSMVDIPLSSVKPYPPPSIKRKLLSPRIDDCLQEVIDLTLKYHVIPTYKVVGQDDEAFFKSVLPQIWGVLLTLLQRMGQIDTMKLVSQDVVQLLKRHFENFRGIHGYRDGIRENKFPNLDHFPYLESPEHELNFLRQVCEVFICACLPKDLLDCTSVRVLVKEYLTCQILQPTIDMICDPDYINQKMLAYLLKKEENSEQAKLHTYKYKDFEDFVSHINKCEDVAVLQNIRQSIITDIIVAKAVYKMKHSHTTGLQGKQFPIPIPAEKVKVLMGRDLELYIRQLGTAKTRCDRQLRKQGGEEDYAEDATPVIGSYSKESQRGDRPLGIPFETIMKNEVTRIYLLHFMDACGYSHLLLFWIAAESLRNGAEVSSITKLYDSYLNPLSPDALHVEVDLIKPIHDFVHTQNFDACLQSIAIIQKLIYEEIRDQFYNNFICSENYRELMCYSQSTGEGVFGQFDNISITSHMDDESHHRKKLKSLKIELENKDSQLSLMPDQVQTCPSLVQRKRALKKDSSNLREEIKKLEHYIDHTEEWFDTVGQWSVQVHSVDLSKEEHNDRNPFFLLVVHRQQMMTGNIVEDSGTANDGNPSFLSQDSRKNHEQQHQFQQDGASTGDSDDIWSHVSETESESRLHSRSGWVLGRHLSEFEKLNEKVVEICPNLPLPPLPKKLNIFQRYDADSPYWVKYKSALQSYLCRILQDERLKECEEVFNFVSHASDTIKGKATSQPEKKNRFVIGAIPGMLGIGKDMLHEENQKELDATSEYVYLLVSEIFELDHFSKVLRKQLVELVQLTYGKSIDRELQDTMNWVFSEPMLIFYLNTFKEAMWPDGKPAPPGPTRSDEEKAKTKEEAKVKLLKNGPQALQTILGQRNCQIGMQKIFELLQNSRGNKQLFYALLEVLVYAFVPELEQVELDGDDTTTDWKEN